MLYWILSVGISPAFSSHLNVFKRLRFSVIGSIQSFTRYESINCFIFVLQVDKKFWDTVDVVDSSHTSYIVRNLTPGTDYYFRVIAENDTGRSKPYALPEPFIPRSRYGMYLKHYGIIKLFIDNCQSTFSPLKHNKRRSKTKR